MAFTVLVDDNYHHMDAAYRHTLGAYQTYEQAVTACKDVVDRFIARHYKGNTSARELYRGYTGFGEDPFVNPEPGGQHFSAWEYARQRCEELGKLRALAKLPNDSAPEPAKSAGPAAPDFYRIVTQTTPVPGSDQLTQVIRIQWRGVDY